MSLKQCEGHQIQVLELLVTSPLHPLKMLFHPTEELKKKMFENKAASLLAQAMPTVILVVSVYIGILWLSGWQVSHLSMPPSPYLTVCQLASKPLCLCPCCCTLGVVTRSGITSAFIVVAVYLQVH